jgi:hypothetical protein
MIELRSTGGLRRNHPMGTIKIAYNARCGNPLQHFASRAFVSGALCHRTSLARELANGDPDWVE